MENEVELIDGVYEINLNGTNYDVYCSFDSENDFGWTLFESGNLVKDIEHLSQKFPPDSYSKQETASRVVFDPL